MGYQILLIDDHKLMRQAIKGYIEQLKPNYQLDEAMNEKHAIQLASKKNYDLIITDINMPVMTGFELIDILKQKKIEAKILTVSMHFNEKYVKQMLEAEVDGYVTKNSDSQEFMDAIDSVLQGDSYFSKDIMNTISRLYRKKPKPPIIETLSEREMEILYLILKEYTNKQIAQKLSLSIRTVETHKYNLMQKIEAKNVLGLLKFALRNNLFEDLI